MSSSLPVDTPPPEEITEAYFSNTATPSSSAVDEDETPLVAVLGVGYVGMQLVTAFAQHYDVVAYDVSEKRLKTIAGELERYPSVTCTSNASNLASATHFLISVPTTLLPNKQIDTSFLQSAIYTVGLYARPGATVVVESSVAVGMTRSLLSTLMATRGLKAGMSPERVDPGRTVPTFETIPKIISGLDDITPNSLASIDKLYSKVFDRIVTVSSPEVAEMTKLYENCQRMVCIAYANEMADACVAQGIDPYEVCSAAASKPFGYQPFSPGLGVGGHCIPVNPYYLLSNNAFPVLQAATEKMWDRPAAQADSIMEKFVGAADQSNTRDFGKRPPRVLVVGAAFKPGQSTISHSPAILMMKQFLDRWDAHVTFADPLVDEEAIPFVPRLDEETEWNKETLERDFDVVVVAMKQTGLDFGVLESLEGVEVVSYSR